MSILYVNMHPYAISLAILSISTLSRDYGTRVKNSCTTLRPELENKGQT